MSQLDEFVPMAWGKLFWSEKEGPVHLALRKDHIEMIS